MSNIQNLDPDQLEKYIVKTPDQKKDHAKFLIQRAMLLESENEELSILLDIAFDALKTLDKQIGKLPDGTIMDCNHMISAMGHIRDFRIEQRDKNESSITKPLI